MINKDGESSKFTLEQFQYILGARKAKKNPRVIIVAVPTHSSPFLDLMRKEFKK